jgi:DNA-directed RNA polymerase sigma subunit (sigma70/sigma32)
MTGDEMDELRFENRDLPDAERLHQSHQKSQEGSVVQNNQQEGLMEEMSKLLTSFHPKEAGIIRARFGLGDSTQKTLDQISSEFGVTIERIRQIESKAMSLLRYRLGSKALRDLLGES